MQEKKVLLIEDWDEFLKDLNVATLESRCVVVDVEFQLLKHERKNAIQFEAHVGPWRFETGIVRRGVLIPVEDEKKFELGDKVTCFIFKKEV